MDILVSGLLLAGTYALVAMGLNLQYGVARIMNLANGEILVLGALAAFWLYTTAQVSPLLTVFLVAPVAFVGNWLIYRCSAAAAGATRQKPGPAGGRHHPCHLRHVASSLIGIMRARSSGGFFTYKYLSEPIVILGNTYRPEPVRRLR